MRRHMVLYPWRVALFVLCCLAWLAAIASIPLLAIFVIPPGKDTTAFLVLSIMFGGGLLLSAVGGLVCLGAEWAFNCHYLSQEHRDYVMA